MRRAGRGPASFASAARGRQAGITVIGFLILAGLFGLVGFAALRLVPMYLQNMRVSTILEDVREELDGTGTTLAGVRTALDTRFIVEGIDLSSESINIEQVRNGYRLRVHYDNRARYIANVWLLVAFDKQVEIRQ